MKSRDNALKAAKTLSFPPRSLGSYIRELILAGFFDSPSPSKQVIRAVKGRSGRKFPVPYVQTYMKPFLQTGILRCIDAPGRRGNLWCGAWLPDSELSVRSAAEKLRIKFDTTRWNSEVAEDYELALACLSSQLWKPAAVMVRRAYEGALSSKYEAIEARPPEKEGACQKCGAKFGKRPMSITDLHYWAARSGLVRQKMEGLSILLKDLGAGGAHPTKSIVVDPDTAEIIVRCGAVLLNDLHRKKSRSRGREKTQLLMTSPPRRA